MRVAEKCSYMHEGTLRNAWVDDGKPYTMEIYSLLGDECLKLEDLLAD
jgi:RimJ/RimL family protein N-acetyltransferase